MTYPQPYRLTPYGAPRLGRRAVTPAEKLKALQLLEAYIHAVTHDGQYYPVRGRYIPSGVAAPSGGRPAIDPGSAI
jgi:hypothetical protein